MPDVIVLDVLLYDQPIGNLTHIDEGRVLFTFRNEYVEDMARPVLSLGFKSATGELITEFKSKHTRLMPFFSNLLPEGPMRNYLAKLAGVHPDREFFLLWALGEDLPGAITVRSADGRTWTPAMSDNGHDDGEEGHAGQALRFSLAGVQIKFSAVQEATGGLTIPVNGMGGSWIVKLPSAVYQGVPENEFSMMTLARMIGMNVPALKLVSTDEIGNLPVGMGNLGGPALAIERFDRKENGSRVHFEDFAQIFGVYPEKKYETASMRNIATVIASECAESEITEFTRRLVFGSLIGNADMHLKNWSMIYYDRRNASLAPAYDFVSTVAYIRADNAALKFSRNKRFDRFSVDELSHLAAKAQLPRKIVLDSASETVELFLQYWQSEKNNLPLSRGVVEAIETHLKTVPIISINQ